MHTYKTLKELENEASEQKLDHVLSHPFFAKKSSLQEKAMKPEAGDGHNHGSEDLDDYEAEVKDGMDVTKAKVRKRAKELQNSVDLQNKTASTDSYGESFDIDESCGCEDVTARVDGRTKAYRETYTRIMNRLAKLKEKAKKHNMEQYGEKEETTV
tara:strand:- start:227 stop:694 length:468 start_codon:yes stop_codon:yes gene_type:complete